MYDKYEVYYEAYEQLALAEALRLTNNLNRAYKIFSTVARITELNGHQLEQAHALLGIAESKRLMDDTDEKSCAKALHIYRKVGSKWGEVHALIALALIARGRGKNATTFLKEALAIAQEASLISDVRFVESLASKKPAPGNQHILIFI
ncbi:MAG: hypothetical protein HF973_12905 [Chloroflexi bacterium]|nr:hypothetical protein [Chloroflexota bacterium]